MPNKQKQNRDDAHAYSDSENFQKDQKNYQKKYSTFFTNDFFTNNSNKAEDEPEKIGYNNSYKAEMLNNQINNNYSIPENQQKQTENFNNPNKNLAAEAAAYKLPKANQTNDSYEFNIPVQSTNQTHIINSAANKNLIESSNALVRSKDFEITANNDIYRNCDNYNNHNANIVVDKKDIQNNNNLIYNHLQENLIIPRNYNENPPVAVRPCTSSRKKYIFCLSLLIILLIAVLGFLFLLFFTDFFRDNRSNLLIRTAYSNSAKAEPNKSTISLLSKLQIDCQAQSVLHSFNLETKNYSDFYFKYTCGEATFPAWTERISKQSNSVFYNELLENEFEALSKLIVACPHEYGISALKLNYVAFGRIYYDYSCVKIKGKNFFQLHCRDSSSDAVEVVSRDPFSLLDLKCYDYEDHFRFLNTVQFNYNERHDNKKAYYLITSCGLWR